MTYAITRCINFNSRPSARGDPEANISGLLMNISIHAPPRGATRALLRSGVQNISIHAPPRGATEKIAKKCEKGLISIHAPPRGATPVLPALFIPETISIHAPPRGATDLLNSVNRLCNYFNSRPSARGDVAVVLAAIAGLHFNSRPSARGDTLRDRLPGSPFYFNSRPSARGDEPSGHMIIVRKGFQFTPLREGRPEGRRQKICNFCKSFVQPLQISMA